MKRHNRIVATFLGLLSVSVASLSFGQSAGILPVDPASLLPKANSLVKVRLINSATGADVTGTWLPDLPPLNGPAPVRVEIVVEGPTAYTLSFVPPAVPDPVSNRVLATSAYPGSCTNFGTELTPDFDFNTTTKMLTPSDFGGMAVIKAEPTSGGLAEFFIIPQDSDFDGIPDIYERQSCGTDTCLAREGDPDTGPAAGSPVGDYIANIDEYRGFRVNGVYVRGNANVKDVFVHFHEAAQCTADATLTDDSGALISLASFYPLPTNPNEPRYSLLFTNMNTLGPNMQVHYIASSEWTDLFLSYDTSNYVTLSDTSSEGPIIDRQINPNALVPLGRPHPIDSTIKIAKGVRLVQCLKTSGTDLGVTRKFPPDGSPGFSKDDGTAIIFPQRIWTYYKNRFLAGGTGRFIRYFVYEGSGWVLKNTWSPLNPLPSTFDGFYVHEGVKKIMKEAAFPFYAAHEALGHGLDLTLTTESTRTEAYGYHHADGTGTNVDIRIVNTVDKSGTGYNRFYIPKSFGIPDKEDMRLSINQPVQ